MEQISSSLGNVSIEAFCSEEIASYHRWGRYHSPPDGLQVNALATAAQRAQRFEGDWKFSEQKALSQRSEELTTMSLLFLEYMKINCLGIVVDKLSRESSLPDFQA